MKKRNTLLLLSLFAVGTFLFCVITGYILYLDSYHEKMRNAQIELSSYNRFRSSTPEYPAPTLPRFLPSTIRWYIYREYDYFAAPVTPHRGSVGVIFSGWTKTDSAELARQNPGCTYSLFIQNGDSYPFSREYGAIGATATNKLVLLQCLVAAAQADEDFLGGIDIKDP